MKVCGLLDNQALEHLGHQWTTLRCLKTALIYGKLIDNLKSRVHWWFFKDFYTFFHFFFRFLQISIVFVLFWFDRPIKKPVVTCRHPSSPQSDQSKARKRICHLGAKLKLENQLNAVFFANAIENRLVNKLKSA